MPENHASALKSIIQDIKESFGEIAPGNSASIGLSVKDGDDWYDVEVAITLRAARQ